MQILVSSFLLIQCLLVLSVYGECPQVRECMNCRGGAAECVLSADSNRLECKAANTTVCQPETCNTPFYTCMASWSRATVNNPWIMFSSCVSSGTADPCDTGPICQHNVSSFLPDTVARGTFYCVCYGNFCNQNFLVDITPDPVNDTTSISSPSTATAMVPTPTVELTERDCISCSNVPANCTLSGDKRSLQCFIDNECTNNIIRCTNPREICGTSWFRLTSSSSSQWSAFAGCLSDDQMVDVPTCQGRIRRQPIPGSVEEGSFFCTCRGALCNREFGIVLPDPGSSTMSMSPSISMLPTSTDSNIRNTTTFTMAPASSTGSRTANTTTTGGTISNSETQAVNVHRDGKWIIVVVVVFDTDIVIICKLM